VLPLAVLLPGITRGEVPLSTSTVFAFPPWEAARPEGDLPAAQPESNLMAQRYYPWYVFLSEAGSPWEALWNPYENTGMPFFAMWQTRCLSPFSLPFYLGAPGNALTWSVYLKLIVAGLCAFYAALRLGFHRPVALFVGIASQLCPGLILWWGYPMSDVLPWLPLFILFCERIVLGHYRMWLSGVVVVGLMLLGGDPQTVLVFLAIAVLFLLTRSRFDQRGVKRAFVPLLILFSSTTAGALLSAVQLLPFLEFVREARDLGLSSGGAALGIWDLSLVAFPHLQGAYSHMLREGGGSLQTAGLLHVGIAQTILLPVWFAMRPFANVKQRIRIESLLVPSLLMTILALLWGPVLQLIPCVRLIEPQHYLAANAFILALSAAATSEEWIHLNAEDCQDTLKRLLIAGPVFLLGLAGCVTLGALHPEAQDDMATLAIIPASLAAAVLVIFGVSLVKPSASLIGYGLSVIAGINALATFGVSIPFNPPDKLYPDTPFIELLRKSGNRASGTDALERWPLQANLVPQVFASSGVALKRQADFRARIDEDPLLMRRMGSPMLLLTREDIQGKFAPIRPILRVEHVFPAGAVLFFDSESRSRARMVYNGRAIESYDPDLVGPGLPPAMEGVIPPNGGDGEAGTAELHVVNSNTQVRVDVASNKKGVLVIADSWYPGWTATVDSRPADVFPVDLMFRGVEIPEGADQVDLRYEPLSVRYGLYTSGITAIVVLTGLLMLVPGAIRRFRHRRKWEF
jgi:hypothetical protein